ncbi:hypothetical protein E4198_05125 [Streptomyces sp. RKND-216]|uniref:hypothetical protein n=1 Tax=Streptomyces sp. RKND-216 TaxID=2562581 RepID=UPI00109DEC51|nr:hypothetical protein [Streptomyces sp. RKND-216]THA24204.1 hypothetical protein E4198_05125 [Streptomyces sp. RKND-216]
MAFWGGLFVLCYALTLFVLTDGWFLLAMPGIIGMAVLGSFASTALLDARPPVTGPWPTDTGEPLAPVAELRSALLKRYPVLLAVVAALVAAVVLVQSDYLIPLAPFAMMTLVFGSYTCLGRLVALRRCGRVLEAYPLVLQERVQVLNRASGGRGHILRLGRGDEKSPKLLGRQVGRSQPNWTGNLSQGAWFAGDQLFGGVLLVPGSGGVVWAAPNDGPALLTERQAAAPERRDRAKRAGIGGGGQ